MLVFVGLDFKVLDYLIILFGGEVQCISIVRVLIIDFKLFFLDEFILVFDEEIVYDILKFIRKLYEIFKFMIVFVLY